MIACARGRPAKGLGQFSPALATERSNPRRLSAVHPELIVLKSRDWTADAGGWRGRLNGSVSLPAAHTELFRNGLWQHDRSGTYATGDWKLSFGPVYSAIRSRHVPCPPEKWKHDDRLVPPHFWPLRAAARHTGTEVSSTGISSARRGIWLIGSGGTSMRFKVTTEGPDRLGLRQLAETFANDQWLPARLTPKQAEEIVLDQFRRAVAMELELLLVSCTEATA